LNQFAFSRSGTCAERQRWIFGTNLYAGDRFKGRADSQKLDKIHSSAYLEVDGGISVETLPSMKDAGRKCVVSATAIFKHPNGIEAESMPYVHCYKCLNKNHGMKSAVTLTGEDKLYAADLPSALMHLAHSTFFNLVAVLHERHFLQVGFKIPVGGALRE